MATEICGLRNRGSSYQGADSVSLSKFSEDFYSGRGDILLMVNPDIHVFGSDERNTSLGYGNGIDQQSVGEEGYSIGNHAAYQNEVLAAN